MYNTRFFWLGLFLAGLTLSCGSAKWSAKGNDGDQMLADISFLASDKLEGRAFGSAGEQKAGDYIAKRFRLLGLVPEGDDGTFYQTLTVSNQNPHGVEFAAHAQKGEMTGRNVIGYMDHGAPYTVIVGAHYDHLGYGNFGSLYMGEPAIHNGADDNASGVAMILELAQRLQPYKEHNYLFIAFTGEENGLWGSNYFCDHPTFPFTNVVAMVNFDMVGRMSEHKLAINGTGTSPSWPDLIKNANLTGLDITMGESGIGPSDHTSFYLEDIPSIHFFTGAHEDYHKPSDDADKINVAGMESVADIAMRLLRSIGHDGQDKLEFTKTKDQDNESVPKMEVTLGVLPDYLYSGPGLKLDGVHDGKPAAMAGLQKDDIIVRMGDRDVADIYGYMDILSTFHKGDTTSVVIKRGDAEKTMTVHF